MTRPTAGDFPPEVMHLFDQFVHGDLGRRGFLDAAGRLGGSAAVATAWLAALSPQFALAQQVTPEDARISARRAEFPSPQGYGQVSGLIVQPSGPAPVPGWPAVLVVHENRGLNPYIEDVARRLAVAGYLAFAPDALAPLGGYPGNEDAARKRFTQLDPAKSRQDFLAAAQALHGLPQCSRRVGVVGFCYGGGMANWLATQWPELAAAVSFYGGQAPAADVPRIKSPVQLHYAGTDERINAGWPAYEAALKAAGVAYEAHLYPGTQHGFHNDTTPRFDAPAATLAWQRTMAFFDRHLRT